MTTQLLPPTALSPNDPDDGDTGRQLRGMAIAALVKIHKNKLGYKVPSQSDNGSYIVNVDDASDPYCSCDDFQNRSGRCKHIYAVELYIQREGDSEAQIAQHTVDAQGRDVRPQEPTRTLVPGSDYPKPARPKYDLVLPSIPVGPRNPATSQNWPAYDAAQEYEEELFVPLLRELCDTIEQPLYEKGRPRLPLSDVVFSLVLQLQNNKG